MSKTLKIEKFVTGFYVNYKNQVYIITKSNEEMKKIQIYNPVNPDKKLQKLTVSWNSVEWTKYQAQQITVRTMPYLVTSKNTIISLTSSKMMNWPDNSGLKNEILNAASLQREQWKQMDKEGASRT